MRIQGVPVRAPVCSKAEGKEAKEVAADPGADDAEASQQFRPGGGGGGGGLRTRVTRAQSARVVNLTCIYNGKGMTI